MKIEFKGDAELLAKLKELEQLQCVEQGMKTACAVVEASAKKKAPKRTGNLRRSISSRVRNENQEVIGEVYTPCEYAPYVEYGTGLFAENGGRTDVPWFYKDDKGKGHLTSGQKPQPYMRPALLENRDKIVKILGEEIKND